MRQASMLLTASAIACNIHAGNMAHAQVAAPPAAAAQDAGVKGDAGVKDIVVTAERRSSSVQRTGLAIEALDPGALVNSGGIKDARDLAVAVPAVHIASLGLYTNIYIHGVGGGVSNPYGSPAVAYSIDGVFIDNASGAGSAFYDLSRVEVVKGPQGTLYGRNATAGALNLITNAPTKELSASVKASYGNYNDVQVEGMLNVPLSDTLTSRIAFKYNKHDGYLSNGTDDTDSTAARAQLLWQPDNHIKLHFYFDYAKAGGRGLQSVPFYPGVDFSTFGTGPISTGIPTSQRLIDPTNPWRALSASTLYPSLIPAPYPALVPLAGNDAHVGNKQYMAHIQADADMGFATLTVLPAFVGIRNSAIFYQAGFRAFEKERVDQYSVEARLASNGNGRFKWILGGYYFHTNGSAHDDFFQVGVSDITLGLDNYSSTSKAGFGQATYEVLDSLRLTAGIRYTSERKSEVGQTIVGNLFLFPAPTPATCPAPATYYAPVGGGTVEPARCGIANQGNLSFSSTDYKFGIEYDLGAHSLLYVNVSSGFKAGGFNPGGPPNTYAPERLKDYDFGVKNRFFHNQLQLNFEAFYWNYRDQQAQAFGPINPSGYAYIVYPSKSHIYGAAADALFAPSEHDKLGLSVEYQVGKYDNYRTSAIPQLGVIAVNGDGETRPFTPKWSERVDYTHSFELIGGAHLDFNANSLIQSSQYISTTPKIPFRLAGQDGYHKSNASLTFITSNEKYTLGVFVNNIENTFTVNSIQLSSTTGNIFGYVDAPRTYGVRASAKF